MADNKLTQSSNSGKNYTNVLTSNNSSQVISGTSMSTLTGSNLATVTSNTSNSQNASSTPLHNLNVIEGEPNVLNRYVTYNYILTLAALSSQQASSTSINPSDLQNIICRTGGDWQNNKHVQTSFGQYDYFIDDLVIESTHAFNKFTHNSFSTSIKFKVVEPYSMGYFLLVLKESANNLGYNNHLVAPYCLMIQFAGNLEGGKVEGISSDPTLTRIIPIIITRITFNVTAGGTTYNVEAAPYNEVGFTSTYIDSLTDIRISGSSVKELLVKGEDGKKDESLQKKLDDMVNEIKKRYNLTQYDEYVIQLPKSYLDPPSKNSSGPISDNNNLFTDMSPNGTVPFSNLVDIYNSNQQIYQDSKVEITEKRNFHYPQDVKIQEIMSDVIIRSQYIASQFEGDGIKNTKDGFINWFAFEVKVEDLDFNSTLNRVNRKITYRAYPIKVCVDRFLAPGIAIPDISGGVVKTYDYIYTGKNTEIINFNIDFYYAYYIDGPADAFNETGVNRNDQSPTGGQTSERYTFDATVYDPLTNTFRPRFQSAGMPSSSKLNTIENMLPISLATNKSIRNSIGGSASDNQTTIRAKLFSEIADRSTDLIQVNLDVMGDPYYIPSSGVGNIVKDVKSFNENVDGSINYQSGEVDIIVRFRTPIDLDITTGLYKFDKTVDMISGLYRINTSTSRFSQGKFTQTLDLLRRRAQFGGSGQLASFIEPGNSKNA